MWHFGPQENSLQKLRGTVLVNDIEKSFRAALDLVHRGNKESRRMIDNIEKSMWPTFQALPKTSQGHLSPQAAQYLLHTYFAKEHGWMIQGLGARGMQVGDLSKANQISILAQNAPQLVTAMVLASSRHQDLDFTDVVATIATLETLILHQSMHVLDEAYRRLRYQPKETLDEGALIKVVSAYFFMFNDEKLMEVNEEWIDMLDVALAGQGSHANLAGMAMDLTKNHIYEQSSSLNPFGDNTHKLSQNNGMYSYEVASDIVMRGIQEFGKWQNLQCNDMMRQLRSLDKQQSGRVPLGLFYQDHDHHTFRFNEPAAYLREVGAIDDTDPNLPKVLVANYIAGPSNCMSKKDYFSICCISECEHLMSHIEGEVQAPNAAPEHLLRIVGNLSSSSIEAPRELSVSLREKLWQVSEQHTGVVPIHSRLFAQWMHFAFPTDCPYPSVLNEESILSITKDVPAATTGEMLQKEKEYKAISNESTVLADDRGDAFSDRGLAMWDDYQVLAVQAELDAIHAGVRSLVWLAMVIVLALTMLGMASSSCKYITTRNLNIKPVGRQPSR